MSALPRRSILTGLAALIAAPAIVRAGNLMPVKLMLETPRTWYINPTDVAPQAWWLSPEGFIYVTSPRDGKTWETAFINAREAEPHYRDGDRVCIGDGSGDNLIEWEIYTNHNGHKMANLITHNMPLYRMTGSGV